MALVKFLLFLIPCLLHLLLLIPKSNSECPDSFPCGNFDFQFPFTHIKNPGCGLISVDGCEGDHPYPIFYRPGSRAVGAGYGILAQNSTTKFLVLDHHLQIQLTNRSCFSLEYLYPTQNPSISFTLSPNLTVFYCFNQTADKPTLDQHFQNYRSIDCGVYFAYYQNSPADHFGEDHPQEGCEKVQVPKKSGQASGDFFDLLSAQYTLELNVSQECINCFRGGGQCLTDNENDFYCKKGSNRTKVIILAICIPGAVVLLLLLAVYMIWQKKKKFGGVYLLPRNISSDPSSRSFVEDGSFNFGIPIFSYTELVEATGDFDSSKELGDGGFGTVYYGKLKDGREVAIKRLYEHNYRRVEQFLNEIQILTSLRHPNLVSLYGCTSRKSRELLLVYEYIPNGTVADHLHGERAEEALLTWPVRMSIARETATALAYLHKSDIIHRDVKTTNILLDNNFSVKVADFGLSRLFPLDVTHISTAPQGTPGYVDPEYHQCYQLTDKSDVYSFGVVLIELISSMPAVDISRHRHEINLANLAVNRIQRCAFHELIDPSTGYNSDPQVTMMTTSVAELAFRCLQLEKDLRPSMEEVVLFLQDIQSGQDCNFEEMKRGGGGNHGFHPSPETDVALLKSKHYHSSPTAVTDVWISSSSTVASSVA